MREEQQRWGGCTNPLAFFFFAPFFFFFFLNICSEGAGGGGGRGEFSNLGRQAGYGQEDFPLPAPLKRGAGTPAHAGRGEPARRRCYAGPSGLPSAPAEGGFALLLPGPVQGWYRTASLGSSRLAPQVDGGRAEAGCGCRSARGGGRRAPVRPAAQPAGLYPPQRRARTPGLGGVGVGVVRVRSSNFPPHPPSLAPHSPHPAPATAPARATPAEKALIPRLPVRR